MRSLTEWLRDRDDAELSELLVARPDLVNPVPADLGALAERIAAQASVARALDGLDRRMMRALEGLIVLGPAVTMEELVRGFPPEEAEPVRDAVVRLRRLALVWGGDTDERELHTVPAVRTMINSPAGLGPAAVAAFREAERQGTARARELATDLGLWPRAEHEELAEALAARLGCPDTLDELLRGAGPEGRAVLDQLVWGPPVGTIENAAREVRLESASTPVERVLARGLLVPVGTSTVALPQEVALHLRGGRLFRDSAPIPELDLASRGGGDKRKRENGTEAVDRTAAGQAFTATRKIEELLELWGVNSPPVLRAGGLGMRELKQAARELDVPESAAAFYIEVAFAAGLLAGGSGVDGEWLPTQAYDVWRSRSPGQRWAELASAWLQTSRAPSLVGERDDRDKPINALGQSVRLFVAHEARTATLSLLEEVPPGQTPTEESLQARLAWLHPRRHGRTRERAVSWTLSEAELLGVTGLGALSGPARALMRNGESEAAAGLTPLLPEPVDHVLVQPDLTAVAPGPLVADLERELALTADVESTGAATVYRFTQRSVRRALDAGRSASDLITLLEHHSRTPIPQPLRYLVDDVARAHGRIRVGTAAAYLRVDDPGTINELLADRRAAGLGLRRLADTVLASRTGRQELLERLRSLGYAPVAESAEGDVLVGRADSRRSDAGGRWNTRARPAVSDGAAADQRLASAAVRALRAGDRAAAHRHHVDTEPGEAVSGPPDGSGESPPRTPVATMVATLRSAVEDGGMLWLGYLDAQGRASSRIIEPVRVEGGFLTAYDSTRDAVHRFALHRITGVAALDDESVQSA